MLEREAVLSGHRSRIYRMEFSRILVRATNWVGDAVMCVPALAMLRARFPAAHIAVLAKPWVAGLYGKELIDELIPYDVANGLHDFGAKRELARRLREARFDAAILFQNAFEAAAMARLAGIPIRIGYNRDARRFLLTHPVDVPKPGQIPNHQRYYYLELLRRAGIISAMPVVEAIRLPGLHGLQSRGLARLESAGWHGKMIGVSPGAAYGTAKCWMPERFAAAAVEMAGQLGAGVGVFGSAGERELCEQVSSGIARQGVRSMNFAGATALHEFVEIASCAVAFLTNDSGAMHIASALAIPTVAVFGATDHIATGPTGPLASIVREPVYCSPCLLRECPIDHRCMKAVSAGRVAEEALRLVQLDPRR